MRDISRRLNGAVLDSDTETHVGCDEFVVVLSNAQVETDLVPIAAKRMAE